MYTIIKQNNNSYKCEVVIQDGTERWEETDLGEAIDRVISAAKVLNGFDITAEDIVFTDSKTEQATFTDFTTFIPKRVVETKPLQKELKVKLLSPDAKLPTKAYHNDAGFDLYSTVHIGHLELNKIYKVDTGIAVEIPEGYYGQIHEHPDLESKGLKVFGGIVRSQYTNKLIITVSCLCNKKVEIKKGDKIAYIIIHPILDFNIMSAE